MFKRPPRMLSQRNYALVEDIRRNADLIRQNDRGLAYRRHATVLEGNASRPLHIGPQIELKAVEEAA